MKKFIKKKSMGEGERVLCIWTNVCTCIVMMENDEKRLQIINKVLFSSIPWDTPLPVSQPVEHPPFGFKNC